MSFFPFERSNNLFLFRQSRISFSALLLSAILGGFCAGVALETAEGESTASEHEEVIPGSQEEERLERRSADCSRCLYTHSQMGGVSLFQSKWLPGGHATEHSTRNGMGGPLAL